MPKYTKEKIQNIQNIQRKKRGDPPLHSPPPLDPPVDHNDVYVSNTEVRVLTAMLTASRLDMLTASRLDTSLGVSVTCREANDAPFIVRSQDWYSNSKKDTSVT